MSSDDRPKSDVPLEKKLDELYKLIEGIEIAMFTTRRADGRLVSRPMATQKREPGTDLWFVTDIDSEKVDDLTADSHVSVAYYKSWEWVSVSGTVTISQDRDMIRELYKPDWKAWFGDEGGARDGGPDDPRLALLLVDIHSAVYGKRNKAGPLALFEVAKGFVTGKRPDVSDVREVDAREIAQKDQILRES
jgi:general stress protein 26